MTIQQAAVIQKKPAPYSAGIVGLDLTPTQDGVALVLNIISQEVQLVRRDLAKRRREYRNNILYGPDGKEIITVTPEGEFVTVSFIQPDGFGTPFGKGDPEDGGDPVKTALRETLEESGMDLTSRIIPTISHREHPSPVYYNAVFLGNCVGLEFNKDLMCDPFVNKTYSGFYPLSALPFKRGPKAKKSGKKKADAEKQQAEKVEFKAGMYQAARRRIVAILLQLDRPLLAELGRPNCDNADNLVKMVLARVRYYSLFSQRMLKMLVGLKREDIILERLKRDEGRLHEDHIPLIEHIGRNIVLWLPKTCLDEALDAFIARCKPNIAIPSPREKGRNVSLEIFLGECLLRRKRTIDVYADKRTGDVSDEKTVDEEENEFLAPQDHRPNFEKLWLAQEAAERAAGIRR